MASSFPTPERCLLAQAAHWFIDRTMPIPDEVYRRAPVEVKEENSKLRDLFLALRSEDCDVRGRVVVEFRKYEKGPFDEQPKEVDSSLAWPKLSSKKIEIDKVWLDHIDFSNSKIPFGPVVLGKLKLDTSALDENTWSKFEFRHQQYSEDEGWQPEFFFRRRDFEFLKAQCFSIRSRRKHTNPG